MNLKSGRASGSLFPLLRRAGLLGLTAASLTLAACGGDSASGPTDYGVFFENASMVVGQTSFSGYTSNQGNATPGPATLSSPASSIATNGSLFYVGDTGNNRILGYTSVPTAPGAAASFVLGQPDFATTTPTTTATGLSGLSKVSISNNGTGNQLVVADTQNNRVLIWNTLPTATGTAPNVVVGQASFTTSTSGTTASTLYSPTGAMIGSNGKLVVVDSNNNRVLIWNSVPTQNGVAADVVLGQANFTSNVAGYYDNTNNAGLTQLTQPSDVWTDGFNLFVSDTGNNRVLYWNQIPTVSDTPAKLIIGQTSVTRTTEGTSSTLFNAPIGIGSDGRQLYIADTGNNRVMVYSSFPVATGTAAFRAIGQGDFTHSAYNDDHNNTTGDDNQDGVTDSPPSPTARTLHTPTGVTAIGGTIYITDRDNHRALFFSQATPS